MNIIQKSKIIADVVSQCEHDICRHQQAAKEAKRCEEILETEMNIALSGHEEFTDLSWYEQQQFKNEILAAINNDNGMDGSWKSSSDYF